MRSEAAVGHTSWTPDGTQSLPPLPLFPDPLAGLVTSAPAGLDVQGDSYDEPVIPVAKPVEPDEEQSRAMVEALLAAEDAPPEGPRVALPSPPGVSAGGLPPGMVATPEKVPARQRMRQALSGRSDADVQSWREAVRQRREQLRAKSKTDRESSNGSASGGSTVGGVVVALVVLAIFAVIAIQVISSIATGIGELFQ